MIFLRAWVLRLICRHFCYCSSLIVVNLVQSANDHPTSRTAKSITSIHEQQQQQQQQ